MLKKRILASSLASVMALSSVSVVAFADETANATYGEVVTRPELKEHLKTYDKLINGEINNYGSVQAIRFQEAYDHAAYVAADAEATETDFIAAYQMVKAVADKLQQYTNEQLKELLEECKPTYDRNNILNEEINDYIYEEDAFDTFRTAYDDAESVVEVDDLMIVTDAYITLEDAYKALEAKKKTPVLKTEYRAIIKEYEAMIKQFSKYEGWRRGTVSVNPTTGDADDAKIYLKDAVYVTWKELQNVVNGVSTVDVVKEVKPVNDSKAAQDDGRTSLSGKTWIAVSAGSVKTVEAYLYEQSKIFDDYKAASKTTDDNIKEAYNAAKEAIAVFKSWKPIDADSTVKGEATKTLNKYRNQLANDFEKTLINSLVVNDGSVTGLSFDSDGDQTADSAALKYEDGKLLGVTGAGKGGCTLRIDSGTGLIQLDKTPADSDYGSGVYKADEITGRKSYTIKIADGVDYMKYIPVRSAKVTATAGNGIETDSTNAPAKVARVQAAIKLLEDTNVKVDAKVDAAAWTAFYGTANNDATAAVINDMADLDENKTITQAAGSAREYTFINRYLTYALQDLYPEQSTPCSHKRTDVEAIVDKAYDLIDKTGVANIFATANAELAAARKDAVEWLRESYKNKKYKDNDDDFGKYPLGAAATLSTATEVYHTLSDSATGMYDVLDSLLKKYPMSYAEIAEKIADVSKKLDAEVYGKSVKEALDAVSYALSVLKVKTEGNEAFNEERAFNGYNRLYVASDATAEEKALKTALDNLDKAIEEAGSEADVVKGDADGDGKVTINDALRTLKASIKAVTLSESEMKAADVDGVPGVTALDALAILKMALKIV